MYILKIKEKMKEKKKEVALKQHNFLIYVATFGRSDN